jgi:prepilin peptidase CpaA
MLTVFTSHYVAIAYSIFFFLLVVCTINDIKFKIIPNRVVLAIILLGLALNFLSHEAMGSGNSLLGFAAGFLIMLPFYMVAGMGAGDVKLMAAIGSVVGLDNVLVVIVSSLILMGFISLVFLIVKGDLFKLLLRYQRVGVGLLYGVFYYERPAPSEAAAQRLPMAPAVTLATVYVLLTTCHCLEPLFNFFEPIESIVKRLT